MKQSAGAGAPHRRSRIAKVLEFFRTGDADEIRAVFHLLMEEGLVPTSPKEKQTRRRRRLNGADVHTLDQLNQSPDRAEGVGA